MLGVLSQILHWGSIIRSIKLSLVRVSTARTHARAHTPLFHAYRDIVMHARAREIVHGRTKKVWLISRLCTRALGLYHKIYQIIFGIYYLVCAWHIVVCARVCARGCASAYVCVCGGGGRAWDSCECVRGCVEGVCVRYCDRAAKLYVYAAVSRWGYLKGRLFYLIYILMQRIKRKIQKRNHAKNHPLTWNSLPFSTKVKFFNVWFILAIVGSLCNITGSLMDIFYVSFTQFFFIQI